MSFPTELASGGSIAIYDEGVLLTAGATSINFTGAGVTGSNSGGAVTETITGSGSAALLSETANETPDGSRVSFTFAHNVGVISFNGVAQYVVTGTTGLLSVTTNTAVFNTAPQVGDDVKNQYVG